jgi:hypothetical protein
MLPTFLSPSVIGFAVTGSCGTSLTTPSQRSTSSPKGPFPPPSRKIRSISSREYRNGRAASRGPWAVGGGAGVRRAEYVVTPGPGPEPVVVLVVLWLLVDALAVVAPLFMVEPGPGESVGEGSWVLAERVMPVAVPVPLGLGEFCILGLIHSGPNCIFEDDMSGRLGLEGFRCGLVRSCAW